MSVRTFNIFNEALHKAYHSHIANYNGFRETADKILAKAYFHREISNDEFQELQSVYYQMLEYVGMGCLNENQ